MDPCPWGEKEYRKVLGMWSLSALYVQLVKYRNEDLCHICHVYISQREKKVENTR